MSREVLMLVDALAREKNVDQDVVFGALESALASATKKLYDGDVDIRVSIDRETGELRNLPPLARRAGRSRSAAARSGNPAVRSAASRSPTSRSTTTSKSRSSRSNSAASARRPPSRSILQKIRDAEREQILNDFLERGEHIVTGTVKRLDKGDFIVETGPRRSALRARPDDSEGKPAHRRPRARLSSPRSIAPLAARRSMLSRTAPDFMMKLFEHGSAGDRAGPAGNQGGRPRPGRARQDRRGRARQAHRSDRHLRRHARFARAGGDVTSSAANASTSCCGRKIRRSS